MSHHINDQIKEAILEEVESMTVGEFQNAIDKFRIVGNTAVDEMVNNLVEHLFEQKEHIMGKLKSYVMDVEESAIECYISGLTLKKQ